VPVVFVVAVSPLRADALVATPAPLPPIAPAQPVPTYQEPPDMESLAPDRDEEPPLPDEARARIQMVAGAATSPIEASPGAVLHVRFGTSSDADRVISAMQTVRELLRARPGPTRVIIHVPHPGAGSLPMELRTGVAYDGDLVAEIGRRWTDGLVRMELAGNG
jgi:hypothetical protein